MNHHRPPSDDAARLPRLHHHALAARHVLVAPRRGARPEEADLVVPGAAPAAWCPFCAGNEDRTPPDVLRSPPHADRPWQARIVPNAFPFVEHHAAAAGPAAERPAHGVHDVVIESAAHERSILTLEPAAWRAVWELCRRRLADLAGREDLVWATVFKNSGPRAGASLEHLHSQLVALDFVPPAVAAELAAARAEPDAFGGLIAAARAEGRVVAEAAGVVALVPPAPRQPFETWLVPVAAEPFFHATTADRVAAVADLTRWFVDRLGRVAPAADFNWWLHQAPFRGPDAVREWHWHLEILPRLSQFAGFELGTGCHVTPVSAVDSARRLRAAEA
jgi:UDPglucose--hexose-1-phosphate uridylyltransferase